MASMTIRIFEEDGTEYRPAELGEKAVAIEMWYDRHRREWVLYPVDENGYQLAEAVYGFGKAEAKALKVELEEQYGIR